MPDQAAYTPAIVYKRLWSYTRKYWWMFLVGLVGVSLDAGMQALFIKFVEPLIDRVFVAKDAEYGLWLAGGILVVVLLRITGHFSGVYGMEWTGRRVVADLRKELFDSYLYLPASFYDRNSAGQLISKLAYNSEQVASAATKAVVSAFRDIMLLVYLLIVMISINAKLTAVMLMLVPVVALVVTTISRKFRKISRNIQDSMGDVAHVTEEAVVGQRVVKIFQGQASENKRFDRVNERTRRLHMRMVATHMLSSSMVQLAAGLAMVILMLVATRPAMLEQITAGTFTSIFFAMVATLFPRAVGPGEQQLQFSGPGVLWVAALLATLLSLNSLFLSDYEDGSLEQLLVSPIPLSAMALSKSLSHWLTSGLPLVIVSPLIAITYQMSLAVTGVLMATLLLGTISLSLLGSIGAALTVGLHRGTALLSLLILPLAMPVLIFGARTVSLVASGDGVAGGLYFLAAYALLMISISPFATAAALRISNE